METRKHQFSTQVDTPLGDSAAPSPTAFVTRPLSVLDRWVGGTRDGYRGAIGDAWPVTDSATRCHGARWEMAYSPRTCMTRRLHVRLHAMEIVTRQFAARVRGFRAGRHPHDGLSHRHGADARGWLTVTHPRGREKALKPFGWMGRRAERIMGARLEMLRRGMQADCARPWRTPMRRVEPARSRARRRGSSDTANAGEPAYPLGPRFAGPRQGLAGGAPPPSIPRRPALRRSAS